MNYFWQKVVLPDLFHIGLEKEALKQLGQIWQFLPRVKTGDKVFKGQAIATVQTTSSLKSLVTPIAGKILAIDMDAVDRPETINDKTSLFHIGETYEMPWL